MRLLRVLPLAVCALSVARSPAAEILSVSAERAIVREGPGAGYPVLWEERRLMPFAILSWHGDWARVRGDQGESGWIHRSVLSDAPAVVVIDKFARIRNGPGLDYPVVWTAERHDPFAVVERSGDWLGVTAESGESGWIYRRLVWGKTRPSASEPE